MSVEPSRCKTAGVSGSYQMFKLMSKVSFDVKAKYGNIDFGIIFNSIKSESISIDYSDSPIEQTK